jgi:hypothetical protein
MKNKIILLVLLVTVVVTAILFSRDWNEKPVVTPAAFDPKNATYEIGGVAYTLSNGESKVLVAPGSSSVITTRYFGNDVTGDLNFDNKNDIAFLITQDGGGTGLFYYAVVALKTDDGYNVTNAFLIGDRIAPQNNEIHESELHINFAERKVGEPMIVQPSVGAVTLLKVTPNGTLEGLMK